MWGLCGDRGLGSGLQELRQYLSGLAEQCSGVPGTGSPLVVILDNLHHVSSLGEIFNGIFNCSYQRWLVPPRPLV